jgi:glyoxylase-like metal-dependent hydrolase (beta-lactamase superfamily II)
MITCKNFIFNELGVNAFVIYDETAACILVDPACNSDGQRKKLREYIRLNSLKPQYIVNTHGHFDHIAGNAWAKSEFGCPLLMHRDDLNLLTNASQYAEIFGIQVDQPPEPDHFLEEGEVLRFGHSEMAILHVPGHSSGSICLFSESDKLLIAGDVLFKGGIGRTDFEDGDYNLLIKGIQTKLMVLPGDTVVWPGHGPPTTIGQEHDTNPFL